MNEKSAEQLEKIDTPAIDALAQVFHAYFLGLQLAVSSEHPPSIVYEWMFRLFRQQHEDKFLSSFAKLGLNDLPDAVACAQYHVLANSIGGVPVHFYRESDQKAWVRFRYPRWMFAGPTLCGIPREASEGFLRGWYAHNGVSLNNPQLGFVCTSEDMTGEYGFCGYFKEYDHPLSDAERLQFARDERPPRFEQRETLAPPDEHWNAARLAKAKRNYGLDFVVNGVKGLIEVLGLEEARRVCLRSAKLIGLQYYRETAALLGIEDRGIDSATDYLTRLFTAMGDEISHDVQTPAHALQQSEFRVLRNVDGDARELMREIWLEIWRGALASREAMLSLTLQKSDATYSWRIDYL